jgi:hypothetical protein
MLTVDEDNISALTPDEARALANRLAPVFPLLMMRALDGKDRCLSLEDSAERIGRTARWIRDHADDLPFTLKVGDEWKCSEQAIQKYILDRRRK